MTQSRSVSPSCTCDDKPASGRRRAERTVVRPGVHIDTEKELRGEHAPARRRAALVPQLLLAAAACLRASMPRL